MIGWKTLNKGMLVYKLALMLNLLNMASAYYSECPIFSCGEFVGLWLLWWRTPLHFSHSSPDRI